MMRWGLYGTLLVGWLAIPSCRLPSTASPCRTDQDCPAGFRCDLVGGYCIGADAGNAASTCGTVQSYRDNFDDNAATDWWPWTDGDSMAVDEANGQLEFSFAVASTAAHWAGFTASLLTSLRGSALSIQLVDPVERNAAGSAELRFRVSNTDRVGFLQSLDGLWAEVVVGGNDSSTFLGTFEPATDSWWQVRESGNVVYFETSPDGTNWQARHQVPAPWFVDEGTIEMQVGCWADGMVAESVAFDNLNQHVPPAPWCPISSLRDDFSDATTSGPWEELPGNGCSVVEAATTLHVHTPDVTGTDCGVRSRHVYSVDASGVVIHIAAAPVQPGVFAGIHLLRDELGLWWEWGMEDGYLLAYGEKSYDPVFEQSARPVESFRWLRLRRSNGLLYFDARGDAPTDPWETIYSTPPPLSFDAVFVGIDVGAWDISATTADAHDAIFDHFNLPP